MHVENFFIDAYGSVWILTSQAALYKSHYCFSSKFITLYAMSEKITKTSQEFTPEEVRKAVLGFEREVRQGLQETNIFATMRRIGRMLVSASSF